MDNKILGIIEPSQSDELIGRVRAQAGDAWNDFKLWYQKWRDALPESRRPRPFVELPIEMQVLVMDHYVYDRLGWDWKRRQQDDLGAVVARMIGLSVRIKGGEI